MELDYNSNYSGSKYTHSSCNTVIQVQSNDRVFILHFKVTI